MSIQRIINEGAMTPDTILSNCLGCRMVWSGGVTVGTGSVILKLKSACAIRNYFVAVQARHPLAGDEGVVTWDKNRMTHMANQTVSRGGKGCEFGVIKTQILIDRRGGSGRPDYRCSAEYE